MKAHIGVDMESGLVHTATCTAANVADINEAANLLHGKEEMAFADAGYTGVEKRDEVKGMDVNWQVAAKRSTIQALPEGKLKKAAKKLEYIKAAVRSKVEHVFRVVKRQFGYMKVRYKGLAKNTAQVKTLFALSNLWMARHKLMAMTGNVRPVMG
jgi:IS5 family transposase